MCGYWPKVFGLRSNSMLPGFLGALQAVSHFFLLTHLGQSAVQRTCPLTLRIFHVDEVLLSG